MAPRASAITEQGFSQAVVARIEAPQRGSTRSVYETMSLTGQKCPCTHHPALFSKNRLSKEGPDSGHSGYTSPGSSTLDRSLKSDRSRSPVRALRYLDRTSDIRQNKDLVFASFKKGFDKDISPATISSWFKQTVILCYEFSD